MAFALLSKPAVGVVARPARATRSVRVMAAATRPNWFPGAAFPKHLNGTLPADFGFDPLNLGEEEFKLKWYVQAELVHARFAMLAVAGILFPEILANLGLGGPAAATPWYNAGKFEYFAPASTLFIIQMFLFAWAEIRRYQDIVAPGSVNQDPIFTNNKVSGPSVGYPGFDPLGYAKGKNFEELKVKEIKNGRLAMLAFAGFAAQAYTTGKTPLAALSAHLADPWKTTVWDIDLARLNN